MLHPTSGARYNGALHLAVAASAPASGVRAITILLGRARRVRFRAPGFPRTVFRLFAWRRGGFRRAGRHRITVVAVDRLGHVASTTLTVVRARSARSRSGRRKHAAPARRTSHRHRAAPRRHRARKRRG